MPCNSHELQILIEYISKLFWFKNVFKRAQYVVTYFHKAKKQLAFLNKEYKAVYNGKTLAFTFSVITKWVTQYCLLSLLIRNKNALRQYEIRDNLDYKKRKKINKFISK